MGLDKDTVGISWWEQWGKGGYTRTFNLRPKRRDLGTTRSQEIVADKVGSGVSGVRLAAGEMAAGPRGRRGQKSFSLHLQSHSRFGRTSPVPSDSPPLGSNQIQDWAGGWGQQPQAERSLKC